MQIKSSRGCRGVGSRLTPAVQNGKENEYSSKNKFITYHEAMRLISPTEIGRGSGLHNCHVVFQVPNVR